MKHTAIVSFLLGVLLLATGCGESSVRVRPASAGTADFRQIVRDAKEKVFPAVIYIKVLKESMESGKKVTQEVGGSGVIISPSGEALTNWHVVDKAVEIRCLLLNGLGVHADVIGFDKDTDLALIKLRLPEGASEVPYAKLGDSTRLQEGDFVMAMGAPWGLNRSVSIGIVSCTRRYLPVSEYNLWLQTDAAISPGNSGGPLVNTAGEVIGINARGMLRGGDTGFAIPAETVRLIADRLREFGNVNWSWTGLQLQPLKDFNRNIYFEGDEGVIVAETDPESPARRAGILPRDRIIRIAGQPVTAERSEDLPAVRKLLALLPKDETVPVELIRDGRALTLEMTIRQKGKVEGEELDCPRWDMTVKTINQFDNPQLYFYRKEGVFIYGVKSPGNAANAGLSEKDIILKIDDTEIRTLQDVRKVHAELIANVRTKHRAVFTVLRNGLMRQIVLDFARDYEKE